MDSLIVRKLRLRVDMTQEEFAKALGISTPLLRNYEIGQRLSAASAEKLKTLAAKHRLTDILINEGELQLLGVSKVISPGERVPRTTRRPAGVDLADHLHEALDAILQTGDMNLIGTLECVINLALAAARKEPRA